MVQVDARVGVKIVYGCPLSELALALGLMMLFEAYCLLERALSNSYLSDLPWQGGNRLLSCYYCHGSS
jgi:hypothetical protein